MESSAMNERRADALVIGGGPAGATAALLLAPAVWSGVLVERKAVPRRPGCGGYLFGTNLPLFDQLGIGARFRALAGPPVTKVGLFAGQTMTQAALPRPGGCHLTWGRALSREHLDTWLLEQASAAGVEVLQPCSVDEMTSCGAETLCHVRPEKSDDGPRSVTGLGSPLT